MKNCPWTRLKNSEQHTRVSHSSSCRAAVVTGQFQEGPARPEGWASLAEMRCDFLAHYSLYLPCSSLSQYFPFLFHVTLRPTSHGGGDAHVLLRILACCCFPAPPVGLGSLCGLYCITPLSFIYSACQVHGIVI